jgi:hypothetical protein
VCISWLVGWVVGEGGKASVSLSLSLCVCVCVCVRVRVCVFRWGEGVRLARVKVGER